jgi:hypothetical protein
MEGHASYAAAQGSRVEIVLVKAICDWADGDKNDRAQPFAADVAVDACHHLLSKPNVLRALKAKDIGLPNIGPKNPPDVSTFLGEGFGSRSGGHLEDGDKFDDDIPF